MITFFQSQTVLNEQNTILGIVFTRLEVESVLKSLVVCKASGPNGLSNRILLELSNELLPPFCSVFNQSLRSGTVPAQYKKANVFPVPKKGDMPIVSNYRPISLLNSECKVFERLLFKYFYNHLQDNNLLSSLQSRFIPELNHKSTNFSLQHFLSGT